MSLVTLSFDNGPHPRVTPSVLETLSDYNILSTFFVVGKNLTSEEGRSIIEEAHSRGHWIGNHTYSHSIPLGRIAEPANAVFEIARTQELIGTLAHPRRFFRPYGEGGILDNRLFGVASLEFLISERYTSVIWNAVPRDWADVGGWVDTALEQISVQQESLIVLHDIDTGAMAQLRDFIERALDAGAQFRQQFPESCLLMSEGKVSRALNQYVTRETR